MRVTFDYDPQPTLPTAGQFYKTWRPKVVGMARNLRLIDYETVAHDVLTDFLASGYMERWDCTKGKSFDSFCFWMLRNKLYSALRSQKRHYERYTGGLDFAEDKHTGLLEALPSDGTYVQAEYEHAEQREDFRALAQQIEGRAGQVLGTLVELADGDHEMRDVDVAKELSCSGTTVQMHRQKLKTVLLEQGELLVPT